MFTFYGFCESGGVYEGMDGGKGGRGERGRAACRLFFAGMLLAMGVKGEEKKKRKGAGG